MNIRSRVVKGIILSLVMVNSFGVVSFAKPVGEEDSVKLVNKSLSSEIKSDIYEFDNGATVVINNRYGIYELFVEELGDWSVSCSNVSELLQYSMSYSKHKDDYKKYDNKNVEVVDETCCDVIYSNGVDIIKSEDIETVDVYLPIFGGELPNKTMNLDEAEMLVDTYLERIGE